LTLYKNRITERHCQLLNTFTSRSGGLCFKGSADILAQAFRDFLQSLLANAGTVYHIQPPSTRVTIHYSLIILAFAII